MRLGSTPAPATNRAILSERKCSHKAPEVGFDSPSRDQMLRLLLTGVLGTSTLVGTYYLGILGGPWKSWLLVGSLGTLVAFVFPELYVLLCILVAVPALALEWLDRVKFRFGSPPNVVP